jgi:Cu-Zn family superoxide dismutase
MRLPSSLITGFLAGALALGGGAALAQDATPGASPMATPETVNLIMTPVTIANPDGNIVATAAISESADGVTLRITSLEDSGLEPGEHGVHIHEFGTCDASGETPYASSGGHYNPAGAEHGGPDSDASHAGDLGNLTVAEDGTIDFEITTTSVTLDPRGEATLSGPQGSSIIIHAGTDDLETQPSGDSGGREACGIIFRSAEPILNATPPAASPVATPAT